MTSIRPTRAISSIGRLSLEARVVLRSVWRLLRVGEHLITGALIAGYIAILSRFERRPAWVPVAVRWWYARLCRALGVRLRVHGELEHGCLVVGNHVSWLDIPILGAQGELGFLSKAEVRRWPLIGWMSALAETLFIERGGHQTAGVTNAILEALHRGRSIVIFPEGTTSDGRRLLRFHPRLFAVAQTPGGRLQPVAIRYCRGQGRTPDPAPTYVGDDTLIDSLLRIVRHPELVAHVHCLPPISANADQSRRDLAEQTRLSIRQALALSGGPPSTVTTGGQAHAQGNGRDGPDCASPHPSVV